MTAMLACGGGGVRLLKARSACVCEASGGAPRRDADRIAQIRRHREVAEQRLQPRHARRQKRVDALGHRRQRLPRPIDPVQLIRRGFTGPPFHLRDPGAPGGVIQIVVELLELAGDRLGDPLDPFAVAILDIRVIEQRPDLVEPTVHGADPLPRVPDRTGQRVGPHHRVLSRDARRPARVAPRCEPHSDLGLLSLVPDREPHRVG
ncbi:MAG: hypothetical protein F4208_03655, partial [Gemmatimonadales bacterium]|nr:hypothetical protein [Gemmatimonadales bacterium]